jgi:hypothetical protein
VGEPLGDRLVPGDRRADEHRRARRRPPAVAAAAGEGEDLARLGARLGVAGGGAYAEDLVFSRRGEVTKHVRRRRGPLPPTRRRGRGDVGRGAGGRVDHADGGRGFVSAGRREADQAAGRHDAAGGLLAVEAADDGAGGHVHEPEIHAGDVGGIVDGGDEEAPLGAPGVRGGELHHRSSPAGRVETERRSRDRTPEEAKKSSADDGKQYSLGFDVRV